MSSADTDPSSYLERLKATPLVACVDCKSIYDTCHKLGGAQAASDKRTNLELRSIKQQYQTESVRLRWIDGRTMLADVLTKVPNLPSLRYLEAVQQAGVWSISSEALALARKQGERDDKVRQKTLAQCIDEVKDDEEPTETIDEEDYDRRAQTVHEMRKHGRKHVGARQR